MEAAGKRYIAYGSRADKFRIWNLSDFHLLAKGCAVNHIKRDVKEIADDPYSFWLGGGDYCDFIGYTDKRFDPNAMAETVSIKALGDLGNYGMKQVRDILSPIQDKCLGLLLGNHEYKYELATDHESLHGWLCTELGAWNLTYSAFFDVVFCRGKTKVPRMQLSDKGMPVGNRAQFRICCHHGAGYAQTPGGKLNRLIKFMKSFEADIYFCGHVHDQTSRKEPTIGADEKCEKLIEHQRVGLIAGSYLKTYSQGYTSYGEQKGYAPVSLGAAIAEIEPNKRKIKALT